MIDDGGSTLDPHVVLAILTLLAALVVMIGVAVCELIPPENRK